MKVQRAGKIFEAYSKKKVHQYKIWNPEKSSFKSEK